MFRRVRYPRADICGAKPEQVSHSRSHIASVSDGKAHQAQKEEFSKRQLINTKSKTIIQ
jgi:hypothetical protein